MRIVGEPGKRSRRACSSSVISMRATSASMPSSRRIRRRSSRAPGCEGQPSHHRSSTVMDLHALDLRVLGRPVAGTGLDSLDRLDRVHPGGDAAEDGVLALQPRGRLRRDDEELAPVRVRAPVGHGERAALDLVLVDLVLELVARAAGAGALRAPALDHEVGDHAVEDEAVVVAVARELLEVLDRPGRLAVEELQLDRAVVGVHRRGAHVFLVTSIFSSTPRTCSPETASATCCARSAGTSTNEKRSSTLTLRTSSFSRCVWSTTAFTTSAGSMPFWRPAARISLA